MRKAVPSVDWILIVWPSDAWPIRLSEEALHTGATQCGSFY